jgi:hypothetical protein
MHFAQLPPQIATFLLGKSVGDFRKLEVWQKSNEWFSGRRTLRIVRTDAGAAVSVSANLAEGCGRTADAELRRFVRISLGSLNPRP